MPADTPFVLVARTPVTPALWTGLARALDPSVLRAAAARGASSIAPVRSVEAAALGELADALASGAPAERLGIAPAARFALYGAGLDPVFRIELADAAATRAAVERVFSRVRVLPRTGAPVPTWIVGVGQDALLVSIAGEQLVIARGPRDVLDRDAARLVGAAPTPLADVALVRGVADRGLAPSLALGWIDAGRIAALVRASRTTALAGAPPRCRDEELDAFSGLGRIAIGLDVPAPDRVRVQAALPLDPATAAWLQASSASAPSLPAELADHPILALAVNVPLAHAPAAWRARLGTLESACDPGPQRQEVPAPWSSVTAAALVVYRGRWNGLWPSELDGFAALAAPDLRPILDELGRLVPAFAGVHARDGGAFVPVPADLRPIASQLAIARRGTILIGATGAEGRAHAAVYAARGAAPLARLEIDVARLRRSDQAAAPWSMISAVELQVTGTGRDLRAELGVTLASPHVPAHPTDPRAARRDECREILWHALAATRPALARLGITEELEALQATYTGSVEADVAVEGCMELDDRARACLLAAADPIASAPRCAPADDTPFESKMVLPPLFSFFGPDPLRARLHPPVDGAAIRARLAGTWSRKTTRDTQTWHADAAGHLTITDTPVGGVATPRRYTLQARVAGELELHAADGSETRSFFMPDARTFYLGSDAVVPIASEDRFVVPLDGGYLSRERAGCAVVTKQGLLVPATCTIAAEGGGRTLDVAYDPCRDPRGDGCARHARYEIFGGWVVRADVIAAGAFTKQP